MTTKATKTPKPKAPKAPKAAKTPAPAKPARAPRAKKPAADTTPPAAKPTEGPRGKIGVVVGLLRRPEGATVPDLMEATGWQAHSVRGAIAGAIKKKLGLPVTSTKTETGRIYRIEAADDAG